MREITAVAHQGIAVGGRAEAGFDQPVLPYVPGSTVRGALAAAWIREHGLPRPTNRRCTDFIALFERDVRYGPLLQDGTSVVPLSAAYCKYPIDDGCRGWSADAAYGEDIERCPHCDRRAATGKGEIDGVATRRVQRAQLEENGTAKDGNLYGRHELLGGLTYAGRIFGTHPWLDDEHQVWLGGRATTSGSASVTVGANQADPAPPISPRADRALIVRFDAPTVVVDDAGRPTLDPTPEILRLLGLPAATATVDRWVRPIQVGGWHAASDLPKPTETAIAMGSVVVVHLPGAPDPAALATLATAGVGLRRAEGFGMVTLNPDAWRRHPRTATPVHTPAAGPSVLQPLEDTDLLGDPTVVRWLLDRGRDLLVHRARGTSVDLLKLMDQRVPAYFDDTQTATVTALFQSESLTTAIPLLDQLLRRMEADGEVQ